MGLFVIVCLPGAGLGRKEANTSLKAQRASAEQPGGFLKSASLWVSDINEEGFLLHNVHMRKIFLSSPRGGQPLLPERTCTRAHSDHWSHTGLFSRRAVLCFLQCISEAPVAQL